MKYYFSDQLNDLRKFIDKFCAFSDAKAYEPMNEDLAMQSINHLGDITDFFNAHSYISTHGIEAFCKDFNNNSFSDEFHIQDFIWESWGDIDAFFEAMRSDQGFDSKFAFVKHTLSLASKQQYQLDTATLVKRKLSLADDETSMELLAAVLKDGPDAKLDDSLEQYQDQLDVIYAAIAQYCVKFIADKFTNFEFT